MVRYLRLTKPNKKDLDAINNLLPQLSARPKKLSLRRYAEMLRDKNVFLIAVKSEREIVGMGTLILMRSPGGVEGYLDDVVVRSDFRGRGIGRGLVENLCTIAAARRVDFIELTSNPSRVEANALYQSIGFVKRETNVYRKACNV